MVTSVVVCVAQHVKCLYCTTLCFIIIEYRQRSSSASPFLLCILNIFVSQHTLHMNLQHIPSSEIILYGQSVGSAPSCYLMTKQPVCALILHSPLLSGIRVMTMKRSCLACCDVFPNIDRIKHKCNVRATTSPHTSSLFCSFVVNILFKNRLQCFLIVFLCKTVPNLCHSWNA